MYIFISIYTNTLLIHSHEITITAVVNGATYADLEISSYLITKAIGQDIVRSVNNNVLTR